MAQAPGMQFLSNMLWRSARTLATVRTIRTVGQECRGRCYKAAVNVRSSYRMIGSATAVLEPSGRQQSNRNPLPFSVKLFPRSTAFPSQSFSASAFREPNIRSILKLSEKRSPGSAQLQLKGSYAMIFTCNKCNTRSSKTFSKHAYHRGVVLVKCPSCQALHLVADNLDWFKGLGGGKNIEDILALKGDQVRRIGEDGIIEASAEDVRLAMANISKHHDENE